MSHDALPASRLSLNPVSLSSYSVAICSFAAAPLALIFKDFPGVGLACVGGFYLVVGVVSQLTASTGVKKASTNGISEHRSGVDNLVAEAVAISREVPASRQKELAGSAR